MASDEARRTMAATGMTRKQLKEKERATLLAVRNANAPMSDTQRATMLASKEKEMMASGLGEEAVRRMKRMEDAKRRQGEREKAWLMAHPHRFIQYSEKEDAFCIKCKEKVYEKWYEEQEVEEKKHATEFEEEIMENYEDSTDQVEEEVEELATQVSLEMGVIEL